MFIHTFSMKKCFKYRDIEALWKKYRIIRAGGQKQKPLIEVTELADEGIRIMIFKRTQKEIRYDEEHRDVCAEIIVTPYKLLHTGIAYGELNTAEDYARAWEHMEELLRRIWQETGVDLEDGKICRIDLTQDVKTPSQLYTREIIAMLKAVPLPQGYQVYIPSPDDVADNQWKTENAFLYTNHHQDFKTKVYDKEQNLKDFSQDTGFLGSRGLLRFEISLSRHYLKQNRYYHKEDMLDTLITVWDNAGKVFGENIIWPLEFGDMMSEDVLRRYLEKRNRSKKKLLMRMDECIKEALLAKKEERPLSGCFMGSRKATANILRHFREMEICPVPLLTGCPYIPSVEKMINQEYEEKLLWYAKKHTRGKRYWDYEE